MSKGVIRRRGGGYSYLFLPTTSFSDVIADGVTSGSGLILEIRLGGGGEEVGDFLFFLSLFDIQKAFHTGKWGSSINPSWVLHQQAEFSPQSL